MKQIPGKAAYSATLVKYVELVCTKPCGQALMYNVKPLNGTVSGTTSGGTTTGTTTGG